MICFKCRTENPDTMKFCRECGAKLLLVCPQCSTENLPDDKFCGECGFNFNKLKEEPPTDYSKPQSYTPKYLADKILTTRSSIEGERKLVTVLFADVANYTAMAEKLDPEIVHQLMDGCFKILMDEIHKYEGTINQFTGDGIMALFGAPVAHEDHAQRACYAALSIQKALVRYEEKINKDFGVEFKMRIGLNSGPVIVGSIGDDLRMDYTAVGDTTNLASRIENMARPGTCLLSTQSYKLARDYFEFRSLGKVADIHIDLGLFYWILGMVHLESGELENARHHANEAIKKSQKACQKWIEGLAWILMGRISGKASKPQIEKAEECILQGMKILQELELKALYASGFLYLGELYSKTGRQEAALVKLRMAEKLFQEIGMAYWLAKTQAVVERFQT